MLAWIEGVFGRPISASLPIFNQSVVNRSFHPDSAGPAERGNVRHMSDQRSRTNAIENVFVSPLPSAIDLERCAASYFRTCQISIGRTKTVSRSVELIPSRVALTKCFSISNRLTVFTIQSAASAISRDQDADGRFFPAIQSHAVYTNARHTISIGNKGWRGGPSNSGETSNAAPTYASHRGSGRFRAMAIA
jgi:hypothetical protein